MTLILASGSASRAMLLRNAGVDFQQVPADVDEAPLQQQYREQPKAGALELAKLKALAVSAAQPDVYVIGADQTLELDHQLGTKANTMAEAEQQLRAMRGKAHYLHSAVVMAKGGTAQWKIVETATLHVRKFSDAYLAHYLQTIGPAALTTAGCYQLENLGITLFDNIDGNYFTILGLPLLPLLAHLRSLQILST